MIRSRTYTLCVFAGLICLALVATRGEAQPETTHQVIPGVWFREGDLTHLGHCNNVIIEMKDYLIVVDANFPSGARALMADVKRVSSKPVKYVFDTHHHGDHVYGNSVWTDAGATTLAYKGVAEEMKRAEPAGWQAAAKSRQDMRELNRSGPEPPRQTFDRSPYVIKDGTRRVEFHFLGWAHTRGDGFVYLPKEKVLCTGDAVVNGPYNYTGDANIANWPEVVRQARKKFAITYVLPGHGTPSGPEMLDGQAEFFVALRQAVADGMKQGKSAEDLKALALPDPVKKWVGDSLPAQVKDAYRELQQGKVAK